MKHTEPRSPEKYLSGGLAGLTCASDHVHWSYIPHPRFGLCTCSEYLRSCELVLSSHPPLFQLIDWVDPAPVSFTNDSVFIPGPRDSNRHIHSSGEGTVLNFSLGFKSLSEA